MKGRLFKWTRAVFILLVLLFGYTWIRSAIGLRVSEYTLNAPVSDPIRIVELCDLHNSQFGPQNQQLIRTVSQEDPDLIFLTGDLINADNPDLSIALELIRELSQIAPVYACYGNHELMYEETFQTDVAELYSQAGANFLDFSWQEITVAHTILRVGGLYGYCLPQQYLATHEARQEECDFLTQFQQTQHPTLLLCHLPVSWMGAALESWDVNFIFSGHLHGGQVVLPLLGGLYAPDLGYFPGQLEGIYASQDGHSALVLSAGLGSSEWVPRLNNIPQVVVVNLMPKG